MRKLAIVLFLLSLIAVSCTTGISQEEYDEVVDNLTQTQQDLKITEEMLEDIQQELDAIQGQLAEAEDEITRLQEELDLYKELGISIHSGKQPSHNHIINNRTAVNPTWQQLKAFIFADRTDEKPYIEDAFMCGDFAEEVHNNAERVGIRAGYVRVDLGPTFYVPSFCTPPLTVVDSTGQVVRVIEGYCTPGYEAGGFHALNVFYTTDRGLVYIDCTGDEGQSHDTVVYIQKGKEYGSISLGDNTPLDYAGYKNMVEAWDDYNERVEAYNREVEQYDKYIEGKVFYIGTSDWSMVTDWYDRLERESEAIDREREQLETLWKSLGTVYGIEIYW